MKKMLSFVTAAMIICSYSLPAGTVFAAENKTNSLGNTGHTYYVDADNGSDENDGLSEGKAWQSLSKVNHTEFEPGDAILLKRGCVWTDSYLSPGGSGDENNQNYVSCYGDESKDLPAIISRYDEELKDVPSDDRTVEMKEKNYWTIENLSLTNGTSGQGSQTVVRAEGSWGNRLKGFVIRNCIINGSNPEYWSGKSRSGLTGISIGGYIDSVTVENNQVYNVKANGISVNGTVGGCNSNGTVNAVSGHGVVVRNNYLENIGADGIYIGNCCEPLVEHNVVNKAHSWRTTSAHVALWPFSSYNSLFQYNEAYNTQTIYDGQGFDCDYMCYNTTFQYNYSHDNMGGFMLICVEPSFQWGDAQYSFNVGSTVRYNISENDQHYTFSLTGAIQKTKIYNNTIYVGRNTNNQTHYFFVFDKGENTMTGLHYPDDIMVENNLFYSDNACGNELDRCSNLVFKNNMFAGKAQSHLIENGVTTNQKDAHGNVIKNSDGTARKGVIESSGNIWDIDPLFVNGGHAGTGIENCTAYYLQEGSKALGAGAKIDETKYPCVHKLNGDFFTNAIDNNSINIGAYAGKGVKRSVHTYDGKYEKFVDFEDGKVGEAAIGEKGIAMSGVERITASSGNALVSDHKDSLCKDTNSTKCLALKNSEEKTVKVSASFYTYSTEMAKANGIRFYVDPNGKKTDYTVTFKTKDKSYEKTVTAVKSGWKYITFDEKFDNSKNEKVTPEELRKTTAITVTANIEPGYTAYVDDIQINNGAMDKSDVYTFEYDPADIKSVEDFETADTSANNRTYGIRGSGATGNNSFGVKELNSNKVFYGIGSSNNDTGYSYGISWKHMTEGFNNAFANDTSWEGIQMNIDTELTDKDGKALSNAQLDKRSKNWNNYNFSISSAYKIPFEQAETGYLQSFNIEGINTADIHDLYRLSFNKFYATYKDKSTGTNAKIYLTDLPKAEMVNWAKEISTIWVTGSTQGTSVGTSVTSTFYVDNISVYKNVQHEESPLYVIKEATCEESGLGHRFCSRCGLNYGEEVIQKGHNCEWVVTKEATTETEGEECYICKTCGKVTETKIIPKKSDITDTTNDPTDPVTPTKPTVTAPAKVTGVKAAATTSSSVKLTWNKVKNASGYTVYRYDSVKKKWVKAASVTKNTYTVNKLKSAATYKFIVKAYKKSDKTTVYGAGSTAISAITNPVKPALKTAAGKKKVTLKWNKVTGATGYRVYYKTSAKGKWKVLKTITNNKTFKLTKTKLKSGKIYYFAVKSYKKSGKTVKFSALSAVKKVKIK